MSTKKKPATRNSNGKANGHGNVAAQKNSLVSKQKNPSPIKTAESVLVPMNKVEQLAGLVDSMELLRVLTEVKHGNFSVRMPIDQVGLSGKIYDTLNEIITLNEKMMIEFTRAGNTIGKQGKLTQRIEVPAAQGSWATGVDSLNVLISDLVHPTIEIAHVISSVAKGNLSQQMPEEI
ncbi:MAG: hypothetical protein ACXWCZ_12820, partial [Flavisolibacter sp.]